MDIFFTMLGTTLSLYLEQLTVSHRRRLQWALVFRPPAYRNKPWRCHDKAVQGCAKLRRTPWSSFGLFWLDW